MMILFRYRELIRNLVVKDLKLKYRGSTIGFLWSLVNPLLLILVYSFVFSHILKTDVPQFPYFLMIGILPWNFFSQSLTMATGAIIDNGGLIRKVAIPMEVFPVATVLFALVQFILALLVFLPMTIFFFQVSLTWPMIVVLPVLALQVIFTLGLSFLVSTATVFYRDVRHFTEIFLMLLFWLTPVIYDSRAIPTSLRNIVYSNPMAFFIASYHDILYRQTVPSLHQFLTLGGLSVASLVLGYIITHRFKARFAEEV